MKRLASVRERELRSGKYLGPPLRPLANASVGVKWFSSRQARLKVDPRLLWAAAVSLSLHASLVGGFVRPHLLSGVSAAHPAMQLRIVHASDPQASGDEAAASGVLKSVAQALSQATLTVVPTKMADKLRAAPPTPGATVADSSNDDAKPPLSAPEVSVHQTLPPAPSYRATAGLDLPPRPLEEINPEYPEAAGSIEGTVVLRLLINSTGGVDEVAVVSATPPGYFEASALAAFGKAKFSPGYFLGVAVKSQLFIEVGYTPINRGAAVSGQSR